MKKRALISVYDKTGILDLARYLCDAQWEILSTGGTAAHLRQNGIEITDVSDVTKFPESFDGRVKTLHPAIHAGILARRSEITHIETLKSLNLQTIDLVAVNFYPFFEKVSQGLPLQETIEYIDIGGPTLLRSAAKNYADVIVLSDPADYARVIEGMKNGSLSEQTRRHLAGEVFNLTAAYDAAIARFLIDEQMPHFYEQPLVKSTTLRYGENAHQKAGLYLNADIQGSFAAMTQLGGKQMGYNNIRDLDLAWKAVCAFGLKADDTAPMGEAALKKFGVNVDHITAGGKTICCVAVKHNTPCGIARGRTASEALSKTYACDPISIFGGIVAFNDIVDVASAKKLNELFLEIIIAPEYEEKALDILKEKKDLRIIKATKAPKEQLESVSIDGGMLVQEANRQLFSKWELVTKTPVAPADIQDLIFGVRSVSWVKSNAIVVVKDCAAVGIGGGETNRIWAAELALNRAARTVAAAASAAMPKKAEAADVASGKLHPTLEAGELLPSLADALTHPFIDAAPARVLASDAFFPFPDVVEAAAAAGIKAIIQSGGSEKDGMSIDACNELGIAMVFTGTRYFKH
ncbi:MAG: bifunctional phosphoribosylaminoimidazolecarboxamide formyltransferase/IMP cyclohydrolase [Termitinemataceae bacterium]|nr:MAG: bifunctional phosphoribosylaminoimidazolecarboxamide formyltransferase/IMP cyclohydrolase [Termitinemataceae bacterium]